MDWHYFQKLLPGYSISSIQKISGGFSGAEIYKIDANQHCFIARKSAGFYGVDGFQTEVQIHNLAADLDLAPKLHFFDQHQLFSLVDFIDDLGCFNLYKANPQSTKYQLINLAKKIHNIKYSPFIKPRSIQEEIRITLNSIYESFLHSDISTIFERVLKTPWPNDRITITHNDFHPNNILYDGIKLKLIDWEMAGLGHPFYDIAYISNYLFLDKKDGYEFLSLYLDGPVNRKIQIIFNNLRRIAYGFLSSIHFHSAYQYRTQLQKWHNNTIEKNYSNVVFLWSKAVQEKDPNIHYQLGMLFIEECDEY